MDGARHLQIHIAISIYNCLNLQFTNFTLAGVVDTLSKRHSLNQKPTITHCMHVTVFTTNQTAFCSLSHSALSTS